MPKRTIPSVPTTSRSQGRQLFDASIKENLEIILGQRVEPITQLADTSTTSDIISKLNEIITRIQG